MRFDLKKSIAVGVTALALGASFATVEPALAQPGHVWHQGGWYGGHWRGGWWGPAIGLGIVGGLVAGAAIANSAPGPYYGPGPGPGYDPGCWQSRPTYDAWGHFVGYRNVNVCY